VNVFTLFGTISINKAKAIADLKAVETAGRTTGTKLGAVFTKIAKVAKVAFVAAGVAAAGIFVAAIKKAADYEYAMAKVRAITGASAEEFEALSQKAKQLGLETAQTMTDIAAGMEAFGRAGFSATEIIEAMGGAVALAESQTMDLGEAVSITANVLRQMGLDTSETNRVVNLLAAAASSSNTTVESLGQSMKFFGPIARAMGMSVEETVAAVGKLGDAGLTGGIATRALQAALQGLAKPTDEAAELMEELGIKFFDARGEFVGLEGAMAQIEVAFADLTQEQQLAAMATIFGGGAVKQFSNLLGVGSEELAAYTEEITGTTVAFDQQAEMLDTLSGQWQILKGSFELLLVTIGTDMMPILKSLVQDRIIPLVNSITKWIEAQGGLLPALDALGRKIREKMPILGTLADAIAATFKWLWEHKEGVVKAIVAIGAALVAMKLATFVSSLVMMATNLGIIGALLVPGGALLKGLALLAAGLVVARIAITKFNEAQQQTVEDAKNLDEVVGDLTDSAEDLERAGKILQGAINYIGSELVGLVDTGSMSIITLSEISDKMADLRERVLEVPVDQMAAEWRKGVTEILSEYSKVVPGIEEVMNKVIAVFDTDPMEAHKDALAESRRVLEEWRASQETATDATEAGTDATEEHTDATETDTDAADDNAVAVSELVKEYDELIVALNKADEGTYEYAVALKDLEAFHNKLVEAAEYLAEGDIEVATALQALITLTLEYARAQGEVIPPTEKQIRTMADLKKEYEELAAVMRAHPLGSLEYTDALRGLQSQYNDLMNTVDYLEEAELAVGKSIWAQIHVLEAQGVVTRNTARETERLRAEEERLREAQEKLAEAQEKWNQKAREAKEEAKRLYEEQHSLRLGANELIATFQSATEGSQAQIGAYNALQSVLDNTVTAINELEEAGFDVGEELRSVRDDIEDLGLESSDARARVDDLKDSVKKLARELWDLAMKSIKKVVDGYQDMREEAEDYYQTIKDIQEDYAESQLAAEEDKDESIEDEGLRHKRKMEDIELRYQRRMAEFHEREFDEAEDYAAALNKIEVDHNEDIEDERIRHRRAMEDVETDYTKALQDAVDDRGEAMEEEKQNYIDTRTTVQEVVKGIGQDILTYLGDKALDIAFTTIVDNFLGIDTAAETAATGVEGSVAKLAASLSTEAPGIISTLAAIAKAFVPLWIGTSDKVANWVANANKWITENILGQQYGGGLRKLDESGNWVPVETAATGKLFMQPSLTTIAEREPELAIPLSRMPALAGAGGGEIHNHFYLDHVLMDSTERVGELAEDLYALQKSRKRGSEGVR